MHVFQEVAIQKRIHQLKRERILEASGNHDIDDPLCILFLGYEFTTPNVECQACKGRFR